MAEELYWIVLLTYKNRIKSSIPPADVVPDYHSVHKLEAVCCLIFYASMMVNYDLSVTISSPSLKLNALMIIQSSIISFCNDFSSVLNRFVFCVDCFKF